LQVKSAARERSRKVEFPMKEAVPLGQSFAHHQPRMGGDYVGWILRLCEGEVIGFSHIEVVPVVDVCEAMLVGIAGAHLQFHAKQLLQRVNPLLYVGRADDLPVYSSDLIGQRPEPQGTPRIHHPP